MMSHELRTPLNAIGGYAELIEIGVRGPVTPETKDYLSRIRRAARHLQTLIGDILDYTHLAAGQVRYELEDVRVDDVLDEAAELLAPQIAGNDIAFRLERCGATDSGSPCLVRADPKKVRQIIVNLLTNAIKFTPRSGSVTLGAERRGDTVAIRISDTGRGIPAEELPRIFEPFVQLHRESTPANDQGVGLGLPISRTLARGMNGDLTVVSEPRVGSTFTLTLAAA